MNDVCRDLSAVYDAALDAGDNRTADMAQEMLRIVESNRRRGTPEISYDLCVKTMRTAAAAIEKSIAKHSRLVTLQPHLSH
jgi:hypothetical protein